MNSIPFFFATNLRKLPHISHGFFTRQGGISQGDYYSLNCKQNGDSAPNIKNNRDKIINTLEGQTWVNVTQEHTSHVFHVTAPLASPLPIADAMVTTQKGLCLSILTADCVPVLLADTTLPIIGALHAGWKGMFDGIIFKTIDMMKNLGAKEIVAAIGPCIHQQTFEVGEDFKDSFEKSSLHPHFMFESYAIQKTENNKYFFNLPSLALDILKANDIHNSEVLPYNTYEHPDLFFSYRRKTHNNETGFGCHASSIVLI